MAGVRPKVYNKVNGSFPANSPKKISPAVTGAANIISLCPIYTPL
jgi:hypothetical protein